ncbi:MAG: pyridoxal phosphate-dependent aminotransferase, partial [Candidatus Hydrothermota bacterium]
MAKISVRGFEMVASPIRKLVPYANDAKARGVHVYHLNIGQPDIPTPPAIFDAMREYTERESVLPYGPSDGLPELRQAIAEYFGRYGIKLSADEVFITTGGSEAIVFAMLAVTDVGDEIIVFEPFYTNYKGFAMMAGIKLVPVTLSVETGFDLP